jgi:hypothetical protein
MTKDVVWVDRAPAIAVGDRVALEEDALSWPKGWDRFHRCQRERIEEGEEGAHG